MLSPLRNRFGIPGVISVIALVFAMLGGAYAASNDSGSGKATASAKAKKGPRGPRGPKGPAGPAGPQGPAGPAGAKGDTGAAGSNGAAGAKGVTGLTGAAGAKGATGATGPTGPTGDPWTIGGTLPSEETEMGTWTANALLPGQETIIGATISYSIPLAEPSENVVLLNGTETEESVGAERPDGCEYEPFNEEAEPVAPPGTLCVFTRLEEAGEPESVGFIPGEPGDSPAGTFIWTKTLSGGSLRTSGVWAVTAK